MADKKANAKPAKKSGKKPNVFKRIWNYLRECKGEIKKITWTHPKTATKNFFIVLVVIAVSGVFIFALDRGLYALLDLVMNMYKA
ncbi:MAG: preprotein translocase subunit SecE [Ruminococcus sp.]|nr:preprotein translocase subunit SecE [Ruminococcus sp.]